jgi:hypothetical protein
MAKFSSTNQPERRGRPPGTPNKRTSAFRKAGNQLLDDLMQRALNGDDEAAKMVLAFIPKPKAFTEADTLDGKLIEARIFELTELEQRIAALEQMKS